MQGLDTMFIIEYIDNEKAEVTFSFGGDASGYMNFTGKVLQGPTIQWEMDKLLGILKDEEMKDFKCPCIMSFKLRNDADKLIGFFEFPTYDVKIRGDFSRKVIQ
ncbi:MAG: hypothetical protein HY809_01380 [Nitrospirae bacterium]|nr:hypothetical protein [Nitrospirota bacterium]